MFGKKTKKLPKSSFADDMMNDMLDELRDIRSRLWAKAKKAYIAAESIKVYDTNYADYKTAEKECSEARYALLCAIGAYDAQVARIKDYYAAHSSEMLKSWDVNYDSSHQLIQRAIRELFHY